jgi:hypothetical protein
MSERREQSDLRAGLDRARQLGARETGLAVVTTLRPDGTALAGPDDPLDGFDPSDLPRLLREVYATAAGGTPDDWAQLDEAMTSERHTAVLVRPVRTYPKVGPRLTW